MRFKPHDEGREFVDERTEIVWIKKYRGEVPYLWNKKLGEGLWDNGKHMRLLDSHIEEK